jgi:hypothetical protein
MTRSITVFGCAVFIASALYGGAFAQGAPQTISLVKVDPQTLATGWRTSKVVGSTVVNNSNDSVGKVDDLIVTPNEKAPFAVLSVGGFLGVGSKYVVVPFSSFVVRDKHLVLPDATKASLKSLPDYTYNY